MAARQRRFQFSLEFIEVTGANGGFQEPGQNTDIMHQA